MKCIKMIVPRMLIKHHLPHPEFYGESLVELLNGMVTDVFTTENGELITDTNNKTLIDYLRKYKIEDLTLVLAEGIVRLISIKHSDEELVLSWMNKMTDYSYNEFKYDFEDVRTFISHAITYNSHIFIIEVNNMSIGLTSYDVIDSTGVIDIKIYRKELAVDNDVDLALKLLITHIIQRYNINQFCSLILERDIYSKNLYLRNQFVMDEDKSILLPVSKTSNEVAEVYEYETHNSKLPEKEKEILNEFLQTYPKKLFDLSNSDQLIDLEHSIDYALKTYIKYILNAHLQRMNELDAILVDENDNLCIEDNLIEKYDDIMTLLSDDDLIIAIKYKDLMFMVLTIINKYKKLWLEKDKYCLIHYL